MFSVLYVDDEPALLEIGRLFLEQSGLFSVDTVTSAPEALLAIGGKGYDAIISDYQMPEMNGIEFLKHVRSSGNTVPFIIFTGRGREEVVIQALNEGADFYLQKGGEPVSQFAELGHKVQMAVQQRRAETSIRDHERREADIINFLPDATFAIDTKGVVIAWNRAIERMTGVKSSEILGKGNFEYAIPFYHERRPILIDLVLRDDPDTARKYPVITRDGTTLFSEITIPHFNNGQGSALWFTASPLFDTRGNIVGAIESIREITERKQAEEALYESEKRFRELSDLQPQVVYEADTTMNLTYANQIAFEWVGYTEDEFRQGLNLLHMIAPKDRERATVDFRGILEGKGRTGAAGEYLALRKDGSTFPITIYSSPIIVNGRITGLRGIIIDITERKKAENDLKNTVAFLNSLIDQSPTPMWISNEKGILILINKACCDLLKIDEADVIGKYSIFEDPLVQEQGFIPLVHNVFEKGVVAQFQMTYDTKQVTNLQLNRFVSLILDVTVFPVRNVNGKITNAIIHPINITERKKAEDAVRESEERYRNVVEDQTEFISRFLPDGTHVFVNEAYCRYFGLKRDEILGHRFRPKLPPEDREHLKSFLASLTPENPVDTIERRIIMPNGSIRWQRWSDRAIFDATGQIIEYQSVGSDITKHKEAEEELRQNQKRFQSIFDYSPLGIAIVSPDFRFRMVNPRFCMMLKYSEDELLTKSFPDITHPDNKTSDISETQKIYAGERDVYRTEKRYIKKDGSFLWASLGVSSVKDEAGKVLYAIALIEDITDRKRAEENLVIASQEYHTLLDQIQDVYYRTDTEGRLIQISRSMAGMFGYSEVSEILGKNIAQEFYLNPADRRRFLEEVYRNGKVTNYEVYLKKKDGSPVLISASSHLLNNPDGTIGGIEGTFRDITEQKRTEDTLRQRTEELDYRNRVISTLLETVPIGIFMVEATSGKPIIANREASRLLGRGILPDATEENLAEVYEAYKAGTSMRYPTQEMPIVRGMYGESSHVDDMVVVRPDGSKTRLEIFGTPVIDKQGRIAASLVSFIDITERKQVEETIQRLAQFPGQNPNPVLRIDADGTLLYANNPGLEWLAASGENAGQQLPGSIRSIVTDALNKRSIIKREVELQDGKNRIFEVTAIRPDDENYVNIYGSEITERKRAERTIQETNKKINLLTSITRHDVANQISVLRGFTKIAMMKKPDPVVADLLEKIDTAGFAIARQIAFTKEYQELGMHVPQWQRIREIVAHQKTDGISLSCTCDAEVFADPMLEKVFFNLIDNAARHGERVTTIMVKCGSDPDGLMITVEDNGVGVPLDSKERIFEKGYGKHTGFGLFLAREILAITGITIHETGMPGKGARFEIKVPKVTYRITSSG